MNLNLQFFPSRTVAFYMARMFLVRCFAVLAALVLVLQTLDLLGESGKILEYAGNGDAQLWHYVQLRFPQLVARFLPFSVLLATLITFVTLNQNSEVIAMKAAGISAHQIIAPLILASLGVAIVTFVFQERVVTRATAALNIWEAVDYGPVPPEHGVITNVWVKHGDDLVQAEQVFGKGAATRLRNVTIYDRTGGTLIAEASAIEARPSGDGWLLRQVKLFNVTAGNERSFASVRALKGVTTDQFTMSTVNADEQDLPTLQRSIHELSVSGRPTESLQSSLWHKIAGPMSAVLMPLLGGIAAFGLARSGRLLLRAILGMALGFAYFVIDNFALAMGNFGAYSPWLAAWAPFALFLLIGETVLIRTEE
ncbi:MAG TPA: LPS export ABC transporter permease LptG [Allosphingosinicella sp.]|nr:LPS export ABC transporter permease LptG [Allosphingosinicella sp.]